MNTLRLGGAVRLRYHPRSVAVTTVLLAAAAVILVLEVGTGDLPIAPTHVIKTIFGYGTAADHFIVVTLRLPRAVAAALVGVALGASGAAFQSLSRNPLGSPDIIGFTTGAATGAVLVIVVWHGTQVEVALGALVGCLATVALVYLLAYRKGVQGFRLVLVGIGIGSVLTSINSYLLLRANIEEAQQAYVWLTGSLNGRTWDQVRPLAVAVLVLLPALAALGRRMRMLEMGDDAAKALGIRVEASRLWLILLATGLTAVAVAAAGPIAFVGLAAPQIARRLVGTAGAGVLPAAATGALLLLAGDLLAQRLFTSTPLPVGVVTVCLGGIYLGWLIVREYRSNHG
ncbi:FecCD family ABC transporter permease [Phytohabitans rumicis]|uniref:ABC transporter permease n=1 Tax=Phytohabitans rumicis TaxID=1076125 RepID=A0A6V8LJP1_9ACTN|nr:iron chelate uptake ABC transporter family permease subunit [Phytohabitans rumicis]GFJ94839.1 ABC transporter permease [Phytohabitans rumicis]